MTRRSFFGWVLCRLGFHDNQEWYSGTVDQGLWRSVCYRPGCWEVEEYRAEGYVSLDELSEFLARKARERRLGS